MLLWGRKYRTQKCLASLGGMLGIQSLGLRAGNDLQHSIF